MNTRALRPLRLLLPLVAIGAALVMFLSIGFVVFAPNSGTGTPGPRTCDAGIGPLSSARQAGSTIETLSDEQKRNAATIIAVGKEMGLPSRAWLVALATAMQESTLRNINYGDRDSLGLFQQRPSQGWGSPAEVTDPQYSARKFYDALQGSGNWEAKPVTKAAQDVQRSAFPNAYAKWESLAAQLVGTLADVPDPSGCGSGSASLPVGVARTAIDAALREVGKPYVWGAEGPDTYDCSGLMQWAYNIAGINLPRVSRDQFNAGGHVPVREAQPGDLMFYATDRSDPTTIHHVFLYMGDGQMVEAPYSGQNVRVQKVSWDYRELVPLATRPGTTPNTA
ncbi:C40 family peptidase [Pseudonocardia sp. T1-2H]|uniref:C40 family peptidase n=2 Tax=Pseudonocardia sp. T1-2H TaxID=3128899 RepID=UPI003100E756